jgi:hypothetical protein
MLPGRCRQQVNTGRQSIAMRFGSPCNGQFSDTKPLLEWRRCLGMIPPTKGSKVGIHSFDAWKRLVNDAMIRYESGTK